MLTLSTRLSMIALGVRGDAPPVASQPPLADGIHLRWAFDREMGFPWYGFFLYRRVSERLERTCLAYAFKDLVTAPAIPVGHIGQDEIASDQPLVITDDFPAAGQPELDLAPFSGNPRAWLRLSVHPGEIATEAYGQIGFRSEGGKPRCFDLTTDTKLDGVVIERGKPLLGMGVDVRDRATLRFAPPCDEVQLTFADTGQGVAAVATDETGRVVAEDTATGTKLVLTANSRIATVELRPRTVTDKPILLREVCRLTTKRAVVIIARHRGVVVATTTITGRPGDVVPFEVHADAIDEATLTGPGGQPLPDAALIELCYTPLLLTGSLRWEPLTGPVALPVTHPDYPASGNRPEDEAAANAGADKRIRYPAPGTFGTAEFSDLHESLVALVEGGPASAPMADPSRAPSIVAVPITPSGAAVPTMPAQHPLDLALLTAIHPAMAQMLGLYWVDDTATPGTAYDYLLLADTVGVSGGDAMKALSAWEQNTPGIEAAIVTEEVAAQAPPLPRPQDVRAYALPGGTIAAPGGGVVALAGSVGLRWHLPESGGVLLPQSVVSYQLWRDDQGDAANPVPSGGSGAQLTASGAVLVTDPILDRFHPVQWPPQWPQKAMYRVDPVTAEGWYAYQVSGMDLFGRISAPSAPARWYQWDPMPSPRPWYYTDPSAETQIHPSAVRILDKLPPPAPARVTASALDAADPFLLRDAAYTAWHDAVPAPDRDIVVGLRVSWRWTNAQQAQAPDTAEFRVYWSVPLPVDTGDSLAWQERLHVVPIGHGVAGDGGLDFEIFLVLQPNALTPTLADPMAYAHVGVSAADGTAHTADAAKWSAGGWGSRPGNEGRVGGPAKVVRVWRILPPAPVVPADSERVYATPADYQGRSYYTFRWTSLDNLTAHVFRALDESVFLADRRLRPRTPLSAATDAASFPAEWDQAKRTQVAVELNALNGFPDTDGGRAAAMAAYRALSNDGLRVLAGLPGTERAFTQLTNEPLDPAAPDNANRVGPDNPPDFPVDPALRAYLDTLDGRSTNRYFYRVGYLDAAHNRGPLSLSGPPVWLPKVVPPRTPTFRSISGGESTITLRWASNREPDLAEYRLYRADSEVAARDPRSMTLVHTETVTGGDRPAQVVFDDNPVPAQTTLWYRIAAVDAAGNVSAPTKAVAARAFRSVPPSAPDWAAAAWNPAGTAVHLEWTLLEPGLTPMVQRQREGTVAWVAVSGWLGADTASYDDGAASATDGHFYRVLVRDATGNVSPSAPAQFIPPFGT